MHFNCIDVQVYIDISKGSLTKAAFADVNIHKGLHSSAMAGGEPT